MAEREREDRDDAAGRVPLARLGSIEEHAEANWEERILRFRKLTGVWAIAFSLVTAFLTLSHLYTWGLAPRPFVRFLPLHLGVMLVIVFFLFPTARRWSVRRPDGEDWEKYANWAVVAVDFALVVLSTFIAYYMWANSDAIIGRIGTRTPLDMTVATVGMLLLAEGTRRAVGIPMVILSGLFIVYALYGERLTGPLRTRSRTWPQLLEQLWFTNEGVFGVPLQVAATYVVIFVAMGSFFKFSGVGEFFINIAYSLTAHRRGGPAKTSILASAFMGTVSGSSIGNAVTTGAFTIPMMKRVGYRPEFAGAVEASASAGGQIMPPILGAAAFVMVEFLGIPYRTIVIASIIPALAFFVGAWIMVHLEAKKRGLRSVPRDELPNPLHILRKDWYYLIPFIVLFALLFTNYVTIFRAGIITIVVTAALSFVKKETRFGVTRLREVFDETGRNMAGVTMACGAAGVIGGVVTLTGFGSKIVLLVRDGSFAVWEAIAGLFAWLPAVQDYLLGLAGAPFFFALAFTMVACLVLGMGLPTTATYIVVVTVAAPAITNFPGFVPPNGLDRETWLLAAHMFVLFYGVVADVTPPVALAAYAASGIAGGDQFKTGIEAFKISANKFLVPFAFIYQPAILFIGVRWNEPAFVAQAVWDVAMIFIGIFFLHAGLSKFMKVKARRWEAAFFAIGGALLMFPSWGTDFLGGALIVSAAVPHLRRARIEEAPPAPA